MQAGSAWAWDDILLSHTLTFPLCSVHVEPPKEGGFHVSCSHLLAPGEEEVGPAATRVASTYDVLNLDFWVKGWRIVLFL